MRCSAHQKEAASSAGQRLLPCACPERGGTRQKCLRRTGECKEVAQLSVAHSMCQRAPAACRRSFFLSIEAATHPQGVPGCRLPSAGQARRVSWEHVSN